jgi:hypothetical protein
MGNSFLACAGFLGQRSSGDGSCANKKRVAKVLLVDGSVLRFKAPVKAIQVLMDHPQHFICPLDSLQPGIHSLPALLPHEEVSLGRLYLLLPSSKSSQMQRYGTGPTWRSSPQVAMVKHAEKKPALGSCSLPFQTDMGSSHPKKTGMGSSRLKKKGTGSSRLKKTGMGSSRLGKADMGSSRLEKTEMGCSEEGASHGAQRSEEGGEKLPRPPYPSRSRRTWIPRLQTIEEGIPPSSPSPPALPPSSPSPSPSSPSPSPS